MYKIVKEIEKVFRWRSYSFVKYETPCLIYIVNPYGTKQDDLWPNANKTEKVINVSYFLHQTAQIRFVCRTYD